MPAAIFMMQRMEQTLKGGMWMEAIVKAVVIGVLTVVIAALNQNIDEK